MNMISLKRIAVPAVAGSALVLSGIASADGVDFTALTSAVVLTTVTTAIMAVAAAKVVPKIAAYGASVVLSFISGRG